jgi:NADH dehydrogenase
VRLPSSSTYGFWLAIVRLYTGAFWLMHGVPKFTQSAQFMPPSGFLDGFLTAAVHHTTGPYQSFLMTVVLPNASLFGNLVRVGEVVTGCLLVLGAFTRLGGFMGAFLALNYLAAKGGLDHLGVWSGIDGTAVVLSVINLMLPTGRVLGVDALLWRARTPEPAQKAVFVDEPPMSGPTAPTN